MRLSDDEVFGESADRLTDEEVFEQSPAVERLSDEEVFGKALAAPPAPRETRTQRVRRQGYEQLRADADAARQLPPSAEELARASRPARMTLKDGRRPVLEPQFSQNYEKSSAQASSTPIDTSRPILENEVGSFSTERTITIEADGRHLLIPTIVGGQELSEGDAIAAWRAGRNPPVGDYGSAEEADREAVARSERIGRVRGPDRPRQAVRTPPAPAAGPELTEDIAAQPARATASPRGGVRVERAYQPTERPDEPGEFRKGLQAGTIGAKQMGVAALTVPTIGAMKTLAAELNAYERIDRENQYAVPQGEGMTYVSGKARMYLASDPETRSRLRQQALERFAAHEGTKAELVQAWRAYQHEMQQYRGNTVDATDIRDAQGFADWFAWNFGQGLPYMSASALMGILGGVLGGPAGATAGVLGVGYGMGVGDIQGEGIEKGIEDETGRAALVGGLPYGALDVAVGPVARALRMVSRPALENVAKAYWKRAGKEIPANFVEEFINEAGQEIFKDASIGSVTGEPIVTDESLLRWFNAGMAGGAVGAPAGALTAIPGPPAQPRVTQRDAAQPGVTPRGTGSIRKKPAQTGAQPPPPPPPAVPPAGDHLDGRVEPTVSAADLERVAADDRPAREIVREEDLEAAAAAGEPTATAIQADEETRAARADELGLPLEGDRMTVDAPAGAVTGIVESAQPTETGWELRIRDDEGELHVFNETDRVQISTPARRGDGTKDDPVRVSATAQIASARAQVDPNPTPAQKVAENYSMGHVRFDEGHAFHGLPEISLETAKGGTRTAKDGSWSVPNFPADYGRFKGTEGMDGDHVDVMLGEGGKIFIIDQVNAETGAADEHKVMLGYPTAKAARDVYITAYTDGKGAERIGAITAIGVEELKAWLGDRSRTKKPYGEISTPEEWLEEINENWDYEQILAGYAEDLEHDLKNASDPGWRPAMREALRRLRARIRHLQLGEGAPDAQAVPADEGEVRRPGDEPQRRKDQGGQDLQQKDPQAGRAAGDAQLRGEQRRESAQPRAGEAVLESAEDRKRWENYFFSTTARGRSVGLKPPAPYVVDKHGIRLRKAQRKQKLAAGETLVWGFEEAQSLRSKRLKAYWRARRRPDRSRDSLVEWIAKSGGMSMEERNDTAPGENRVFNVSQWFFTKDGKAADELATAAFYDGYLSKQEYEDVDGGVQALRDKIADEFADRRKHYSTWRDPAADLEERHQDEVLLAADALGISIEGRTLEEIEKLVNEAEAVEQAIVEVDADPAARLEGEAVRAQNLVPEEPHAGAPRPQPAQPRPGARQEAAARGEPRAPQPPVREDAAEVGAPEGRPADADQEPRETPAVAETEAEREARLEREAIQRQDEPLESRGRLGAGYLAINQDRLGRLGAWTGSIVSAVRHSGKVYPTLEAAQAAIKVAKRRGNDEGEWTVEPADGEYAELAAEQLTPRAQQALEVLRAGGYFRKQLETQYRGGEKFETRLRDKGGAVVPGIGIKTFFELEKKLKRRPVQKSSVWPEEWVLAEDQPAAPTAPAAPAAAADTVSVPEDSTAKVTVPGRDGPQGRLFESRGRARTPAPDNRRGGGRSESLVQAIAAIDNMLPWYEARGAAAAEQVNQLKERRAELQRLLDDPQAVFHEPPVPMEEGWLEAFKKNQRLHAAGKFLESPFDEDRGERWPEKWFNRLRDAHGEKWKKAAAVALDELELELGERFGLSTSESESWRDFQLGRERAFIGRVRTALARHTDGEAEPQAAQGGRVQAGKVDPAALAAHVEALERAVDRAFERDSPAAEDLDALLAELREELSSALEQDQAELDADDQAFDYSTVDEGLRRAYVEWQRGGGTFGDQATAVENMVATITEAGGTATVEQALEAAADAYAAAVARRVRRVMVHGGTAYQATPDGPVLVAREVAIVRPSKWEPGATTYDFYIHTILDTKTGKDIGRVTLGWKNGKVMVLPQITLWEGSQGHWRGKGRGEAVIRAILEHNGEGHELIAAYIADAAMGFWRKLGADVYDTGEGKDGRLTLESYRDARPGRARPGAPRDTVGEAREPQDARAREAPAEEAPGLSPSRVTELLVEAFGPGVNALLDSGFLNLAATPAQLPANLRDRTGEQTEAWYDRKARDGQGEAWLIASHLDADRVVPVFLHEVGEHHGLERILGADGYRQLQETVRNLAKTNPVVKAAWAHVEKEYPRLDPQGKRFVSEVIARVGETEEGLRQPFMRRLINAVREFLVRLGLKAGLVETISDRDIVLLIQAAARRVVEEAAAAAERAEPREYPAQASKGGLFGRLFEEPLADVEAQPGTEFRRMNQLLGAKLYGEPRDIATVSVKEMVQNSFDGIKTLIDDGTLAEGKLDIVIDQKKRTITVSDNGSGMSAQTLATSFLRIAGTAKETKRSSGGLGIAKGLFLYGNEHIRVETVRDGILSVLDATGEELAAAADGSGPKPKITRSQTGRQSGTTVTVRVPKDYVEATTGNTVNIYIPPDVGSYPVLKYSPLFSNIKVSFNGKPVPNIGATFPAQDYSAFAKVQFRWGNATIYVSKKQQDRIPSYVDNVRILSNGLWQFSARLEISPFNAMGDNIPRWFYIDIDPKVKPEDSGYPFDLNRQRFVENAEKDVARVLNYVRIAYAGDRMEAQGKNYGQIRYLEKGKPGAAQMLAPELDKDTTDKLLRIVEGDTVVVEEGALIVNGREIPFLTSEELNKAMVDLSKFKIDQRTIKRDSVMLHDNVQRNGELFSDLMRREIGARFDVFLEEVGQTFLELREWFVATDQKYRGLADYAIGVSFEKREGAELYGVNIQLPFKGAFVNPAVMAGVDNRYAANEIFGTMLHELVHEKEHHHGVEFTNELQRKYSELLSEPKADAIRTRFIAFFARNAELINRVTEAFNAKDLSAVGDTLQGREQKRPRRADVGREAQLGRRVQGEDDAGAGAARGLDLDRLLPGESEEPGSVEDEPQASQGGRAQTATPAFKRWFGESKVVDADGRPLVVYHGTWRDFAVFDRTQEERNRRGVKLDTLGSWFTTSPESAGRYGPVTMPSYLSIRNPLVFTGDENQGGIKALRAAVEREGGVEAFRSNALAEGYDGVSILGDRVDQLEGDVYVAFQPEQIKSATGNRGTFDPQDPDIQASQGGAAHIPAPAPDQFQLTALETIEAEPPNREPGDRAWIGDISLFTKVAIHPRMLASLEPSFVPVYRVAEAQVEDRDQIAHELASRIDPYMRLPEDSKNKVNAVLELDRLEEKVHLAGKEMSAKNERFRTARLSKPGETIKLNDEEKTAYWAVRRMLDVALKMFRDQLLAELGVDASKFKGGDLAAKILDAINPAMSEEQKQNYQKAAKFAHEIEQARRRGYVPFTRWGNVVIAVKNADDNVVWAEKVEVDPVEFHKRGVAVRFGRKIRDMPSVARALENAEKLFPKGKISVFQISEGAGTPETHPDIGQLDELAKIAGIEPAEWDGVRAKLEQALKAKGFRKHFLGSTNVPGYSADFERAIADYVTGMAGYLARRKHREAWDDAISGIPAVKRRLQAYARKYHEYMQSPQEELHLLRQIGFIYYLGMIPASAIANLTQIPLVSAPYLSQFANPAIVSAALTKAAADVALMYRPIDSGFEMFDPAAAPEDVREALQEAWARGFFVPLQTYEVQGVAYGRTPYGRKAKRALRDTRDGIAYMFSLAERTNRLTTFVAAYRLAKRKGFQERVAEVLGKNPLARAELEGEAWTPARFGTWSVDETQFRMGKVNRPPIGRGYGAAILQFKGFMMQMLELWYRMATQNGAHGKTAFAISLMLWMLTSGFWGLPGAGDLRDLWEKLYRLFTHTDFDTKTRAREWVYKVTGSAKIAEMFTRGAPAGAGFDLSGRVGMGELVPDSPLQVAGIPADITAGRAMRAVEHAANDSPELAWAEALPNFLRNPITAASWLAQGVRNRRGDVVIPKEQIGVTDAILRGFVGVTPTWISNRRDLYRAQHRVETVIAEKRDDFYERMAKARADLIRAERAKDKAAAGAAAKRIREERAALAKYNEGKEPQNRIALDVKALERRVARELQGTEASRGKGRVAARPRREQLREVYGVK